MDAYNLGTFRFDIIWNLAAELPHLIEYELPKAHTVLFAHISDYKAPSDIEAFKQQLGTVVKSLQYGGKVFTHCLAGHGRSGTALAAIKIELENLSVEEALKFAQEYCEGPEDPEQINFIREQKWRF